MKIKIRSLLAVWFIPHVLSIENDHVKGVLIIWSDCFVVKLLIRLLKINIEFNSGNMFFLL